jgi:hypothetical protein
MINPHLVAVPHALTDLQKDVGDEGVVFGTEALLLDDEGEQVAVGEVGQDDEDEVRGLDSGVDGKNIWVRRRGDEGVKGELSAEEPALAGGEGGGREDFNGCTTQTAAIRQLQNVKKELEAKERLTIEMLSRADSEVSSLVNDSVSAFAQDLDELKAAFVDLGADKAVARSGSVGGRHR